MRTLFLLISLFTFTICQGQNDAKTILDKTSSVFSKNGGIKANFTLHFIDRGNDGGKIEGNIRLKNEKFVLETSQGTTWFNGKTQWSYLSAIDEVNITDPTPEELQTINPYLILASYKDGYNYSLGSKSSYEGKQIYEVILKPTQKTSEINSLTLYIQKSTYHPLYIEINQIDGLITKIYITNYQFKQEFSDQMFIFDKKKYPDAEEIDLR